MKRMSYRWLLLGYCLAKVSVAGGSAIITGTAEPSLTEADVINGGKTVIITLTGDTWVAAGATFDAQRQAIIDGLDSAQSESAGWNIEVRDKISVASVIRTSDTVVTITLPVVTGYSITADETITVTIPAAALVTSASAIIATPTFDVVNQAIASDNMAMAVKHSIRRRMGFGITGIDKNYPGSIAPASDPPLVPVFLPESGFSLAGTIGDGNSLTLTGTGFGTKPNGVGPWLYWEFGKNSVVKGAGSRGVFTDSWITNATMLQNTVAPNRTHSLEMDLAVIGNSKSMHTSIILMPTDIVDFYMFERSYFDQDGIDMFAFNSIYNIKEHRFSALSADGFNNIFSPNEGQSNSVAGNPRLGSENVGEGTHFFASAGGFRDVFGLRKNEWKTDEWEFHQGAVDVSEATIKLMRNGVVHTHSPNGGANFISRTTVAPTLMFRFAYMQSAKVSGGKVFSDFLYLEDSFCRITLSNEPTWEAATADPEVFYIREPQIPTGWVDLETIFTMRQGIHDTLIGLYLYVTDKNGVTQKAGAFVAE